MEMFQGENRRQIGERLLVLRVAVIVAFATVGICFWVLQIVRHEKYEEMAENNHQRTLALRAPRGMLFDRHGKILVENRHSFTISILREHSKDLDRTARLLSDVAGLDVKQVQQTIAHRRGEPSYRPIVVVEDATLAQVAAITARRLDFELPDVRVEKVPTRKYPAEALAAHLFGYVSEASEAQLGDGIVQGRSTASAVACQSASGGEGGGSRFTADAASGCGCGQSGHAHSRPGCSDAIDRKTCSTAVSTTWFCRDTSSECTSGQTRMSSTEQGARVISAVETLPV